MNRLTWRHYCTSLSNGREEGRVVMVEVGREGGDVEGGGEEGGGGEVSLKLHFLHQGFIYTGREH